MLPKQCNIALIKVSETGAIKHILYSFKMYTYVNIAQSGTGLKIWRSFIPSWQKAITAKKNIVAVLAHVQRTKSWFINKVPV